MKWHVASIPLKLEYDWLTNSMDFIISICITLYFKSHKISGNMSSCGTPLTLQRDKSPYYIFCLFVLRFYGPVNS